MQDDSPYRAALRSERVTLDFLSLPLLESRIDRQRREAARQRALTFAAGVAFTIGAIAVLAVIF